MILGECTVKNFGSYKSLTLHLRETRLCLIAGPTGSGKSTLQDAPLWVLFGTTTKNGGVNDVKSWLPDSEPTQGVITVETPRGILRIVRIRGNAQQNDLYWYDSSDPSKQNRGKDVKDTQRLINEALGVDSDSYMTLAYFTEFSETRNFFIAKAKDRRNVFEKIANLSLPSLLAERLALAKKESKKCLDDCNSDIDKLIGKLEQLEVSIVDATTRMKSWESSKSTAIFNLKLKSATFDKDKTAKVSALEDKSYRFEMDKRQKESEIVDKLDLLDQDILPVEHFTALLAQEQKRLALYGSCKTCKQAMVTSTQLETIKDKKRKNDQNIERFSEYGRRLREVQASKNPHKEQIIEAKAQKNLYLKEVQDLSAGTNPFSEQLAALKLTTEREKSALESKTAANEAERYRLDSLTQLHELTAELRGKLLDQVIQTVEAETNKSLETYFDAEFRVSFLIDKSDGLEIEIYKNGHSCVFTQLSKGQRQLLTLCFSVAIMQAAENNSGVHVNTLMFDEALDGLDTAFKIKAYALFEKLALNHESVLIIDHAPEFHALFNNKYNVILSGDESIVERD